MNRAAVGLGASFALMWMSISLVAGPGPQVMVDLTGDFASAGRYFGLFFLASAAGSWFGGRAIDRWGRRNPIAVAHLLAAVGYFIAREAVDRASLALLNMGIILAAIGFGVGNLTRGAGADLWGPQQRAKGVAFIQSMAAIGAIVGPSLLMLSAWQGQSINIAWDAAPFLLLAAAAMAWYSGVAAAPTAPVGAPVKLPVRPVVAAGIVMAASQIAMMAPMSVAGSTIVHDGHGAYAVGGALGLHFAGMFAFAPLVGKMADKYGRPLTILTGIGNLALGGAVLAFGAGITSFIVGLGLLGLGWCFAYVGATVLLTDIAPMHARGRLLGRADVIVSLLAAATSLSAGYIQSSGGRLGMAAAVLAATLVAALTLRIHGSIPAGQAAPTP